MLGYAFQVEVALLELVRRAKDEPGTKLAIERFDDVSFENDATPRELLQTKHHVQGVGDLSDRSNDLWSTLRSWIDAVLAGHVVVPGTTLSLLTTASAPAGSAAGFLRASGRDPELARKALERVAAAGGQTANSRAYEAFLRLEDDLRRSLLDAVLVLDRSPGIEAIVPQLIQELGWALRPRYRTQIVERLLEWWDRRVLRHIQTKQELIEAEEVFLELDGLRDQFSADNLPIDVSREDADRRQLGKDDRIFVQQLQLLAVSSRHLEVAIRDYKRAYMQRDRWTEDSLVTSTELRLYEERLLDEWEHAVTAWDEYGGTDGERVQAGRKVYQCVQELDLWIRPNCQERFVSRGSYQMLANELRVGWHPEFVERLRHLLSSVPL